MKKEEKHPNKCPICGRSTHKKSKYCIFHASAEEKTEDDFKRKLKEHVNNIRKDNGDYDFEKFIFVGDIYFKKDLNITIIKNANFEETVFEKYAYFFGVTFKGCANFREAIFVVGSIFDEVTFKGDANFEEVIFKEQAYFREAIFEGYTDFKKAIFGVVHDFRKAIFKRHAFFQGATFKRNAIFEKAIFKGDAVFQGATFKGDAIFQEAIFEGYAVFGVVIINEGFNYSKETLKEDFNYKKPTLKEIDILLEALLFEINKFGKVVFEGDADFREATFKNDAVFRESIFEDDADFRLKYLVKILYFSKIRVLSGKKIFIRLNDEGGKIYFQYACLENIYLDIDLGKRVLIDFTDTLLRNTNIQREQIEYHILQEEKKEYLKASKIFLLLKNNFHSIGQYEDESWAFKKEKDMQRFTYFKNSRYLKWIISGFLNFLYGYGEEPLKVLRFAIIVILFFSFLYFNYGISVFIPEIKNIKYDFFQNVWLGMRNTELLSSIIINFPWGDYLNSLYFSLTTFATLAFGNIGPLTIASKIIAGIESFIGPFTIALFVYTFARRTGGR